MCVHPTVDTMWCRCMWSIHVIGGQGTYIFRDWQIRELRGCNLIGLARGGGEHAVTQRQDRETNEIQTCEQVSHVHRRHVNENAAKKNKKSHSDIIPEGTISF